MIRLRAQRDGPQYSALQRVVCDLAVFAPWIVVAWIITTAQHQPATAAAAWAIFIVPSVAIVTVRKHAIRLLASYEDQSNWLDLHQHQIAEIKKNHGLRDRWE
jgi:hypothetical protein